MPAAPSAPAKPLVTIGGVNVTPKMAAIGGIALAAILVVVYFVSSSSKSSGITVTPATFSCSSTSAMVTVVMRLPSTVQATDALVFQQDGVNIDTIGITIHTSDLFARQADGSWAYTRTDTAKSNCSGSSSTQLSMGTHTMAILDTAGHVLAQGSFTLTP